MAIGGRTRPIGAPRRSDARAQADVRHGCEGSGRVEAGVHLGVSTPAPPDPGACALGSTGESPLTPGAQRSGAEWVGAFCLRTDSAACG
jgi:hypothetical protein